MELINLICCFVSENKTNGCWGIWSALNYLIQLLITSHNGRLRFTKPETFLKRKSPAEHRCKNMARDLMQYHLLNSVYHMVWLAGRRITKYKRPATSVFHIKAKV
ncbi:hypothetical protein [uncultured Bartonella sp.]|uniref:hypothetical protein n=1 Tax=uncultured Bartonella sp. TaxID=104108 RepID=UPI002628E0CB|nr:hypothetical protein [uncultured Bartonella sp.]